jgi:hypothetical protein
MKKLIMIFTPKYIFIFFVILILSLSLFFLNFLTKETNLNCSSLPEQSAKIPCWQKSIEGNLKIKGLDKSLDLIADLYQNEPGFAPICHDFVHLVGKKAYELFTKDQNFTISSKASYCAYGFYHGFMENLVSQGGDISLAKDFCTYIDSQLTENPSRANLACYHGIGHGWANIHDTQLWGDERAMVYPALSLCEKVTQDEHELNICATGVFDSISIGYYNEVNGLKINREDPYWLCKEQKVQYKKPCYMDLAPAILWLGDSKLDKSLSFLDGVEEEYQALEIETLAEASVRFILTNNWSISEAINTCRSLGKENGLLCARGLGAGFLQFGPPGQEEVSALNFCNSNLLQPNEKNACFDRILEDMNGMLSSIEYQKVCQNFPQYQQFCKQ